MNRVVITGLGVISAAGHNAADFWDKVKNGRSSIGEITTIPTDTLTVRIGAEVAGFEPQEYFEKRQLGMLDRFSQFGLVAAREAVADSGISFEVKPVNGPPRSLDRVLVAKPRWMRAIGRYTPRRRRGFIPLRCPV